MVFASPGQVAHLITAFPKLTLSLLGSVTRGDSSAGYDPVKSAARYVLVQGAQEVGSAKLIVLPVAKITPHLRHDTAIAALSFEPAV